MILVNGKQGMTVDLLDRGFQYGDGLFETIAVVDGQPARWERHMARLERGCERLAIPFPDPVLLRREAEQLSRGSERAVLKLIITRGSGGRGYRPPEQAKPTRVFARHAWPDFPPHFSGQGIELRICETPLGSNPRLAGIKHLNRLEQVLARSEWDDPEIPEGLMLATDGAVIEGTQSNLFMVREGRLRTPDLSHCGVAGIMRGVVIEQARALGIETVVGRVTLDDLGSADELFICNSLITIWPVQRLAEHRYSVGPITRSLQQKIVN